MMQQREINFPDDIMAKKNKKNVATPVLVTALIVLGVIQCVAMSYGIDGTLRALIAFLIAGIVGLHWKQPNYMQ